MWKMLGALIAHSWRGRGQYCLYSVMKKKFCCRCAEKLLPANDVLWLADVLSFLVFCVLWRGCSSGTNPNLADASE